MISTALDRRQMFTSVAGTLAFSACPAFAREPVAAKSGARWPKVQSMLDSYVADDRIPGGAGSVGLGTDPASFISAGTIARGSSRAVDADSLFRIYSMTKPITGMAAMMLIEEGKIGLDQDIGDFIPGFKTVRVLIDPAKDLATRPAAGPITIRNLLTHTAGLGYTIITKGPLLAEYERLGINPGQVSRKPIPGLKSVPTAPSLEEFANRLATLPLIADPGSKWSYSVSLDLMGRIIEIASGKAFDQFLKERMFEPLGMNSTYFQVPESEIGRLTTNYGISPLGKFPIDPGDTSIFLDKPPFPFGGAGLVTSPRDYDRFLSMLAGKGAVGGTRVMKTATAELAMSNLMPTGADTKGTFVDGQGFGAGGRVVIAGTDRLGAGVGTYGWGGAAATVAWVDPVRRVRGAGFTQFMPDSSMPFTRDYAVSVYASL